VGCADPRVPRPESAPNHGVQATAASVRLSLAPASGGLTGARWPIAQRPLQAASLLHGADPLRGSATLRPLVSPSPRRRGSGSSRGATHLAPR
jgi:hypothetical protein